MAGREDRNVLCVLIALWCCGQVCASGPDCVKEDSVASPFISLPTNITVSPHEHHWRLEFVIQESVMEDPQACVNLQATEEKIIISLFKGKCQDQNMIDFQLWPLEYVMPGDWTMIHVRNNYTSIVLVPGEHYQTSLISHKNNLPQRGFLKVTNLTSVEIALRCHSKCPVTQGSHPNTTAFTNIITLKDPNGGFYFWPGRDFTKMNIEMNCTTQIGQRVGVGFTILTSEDFEGLMQWHKIILNFVDSEDVFRIIIDHQVVRNVSRGLYVCATFTNFRVSAAGETFVSSSCDPTITHVDRSPSQVNDKLLFINVIILLFLTFIVLPGLSITAIIFICKCRKHQEMYNTLKYKHSDANQNTLLQEQSNV